MGQDAWFEGKTGTVYFFRVNRRPIERPNLFTPEIPADAFEHFVKRLEPGSTWITQGRGERIWRVGGVHTEDRELFAKLGWESGTLDVEPMWSETSMDWIPNESLELKSRPTPFGFDGNTRLLGILRDPQAKVRQQARAIERMLTTNEERSGEPSTEWSVEPVLDDEDFLGWLSQQERVSEISFVARRPNPEPKEAFQNVADRMAEVKAAKLKETLQASPGTEGLVGIEADPDIKQAIELGRHGFAEFSGKGEVDGRETKYQQSDRVSHFSIDEPLYGWDDAWARIGNGLRAAADRIFGGGSK